MNPEYDVPDVFRPVSVSEETGPACQSPCATLHYLTDIKDQEKEYFKALFLNARQKVIAHEVISVGDLTTTIVHPRELFRSALKHPTASIILAHNHPSGDVQPSEKDMTLTRRLTEAGNLLGIEIVDHIIVGYSDFYSMKQQGYI